MTSMSSEYGTALFMLAKECGFENQYDKALDFVLEVINDNPDYLEFLSSPRVSKEERLNAIESAFVGHVPEHIVSFLQLLCEKGRIRILKECILEFKELLDYYNNVSVAVVKSSIKLLDVQLEKLQKKLSKISGRDVEIEQVIDKSLIGGLVIEIDGKVIDGSLKNRLREVKDVMGK